MQDLRTCYRHGLAARIGALETALRGLRERAPDAAATIRRLAHALHGSAGTYGFPEIGTAAELVEESADSGLEAAVEKLLRVLRLVAASEGGQVGILVVEDDADMARALELRLAAPNREVFLAGNIADAERILAERDVALIVLDLMLPDCDGRNLLIRLRERPGLASLPVIVLSGKGRGAPQTECFALGADAYFEKPVDLNTLTAAVATRLQRTAEASREARQDPLTGLPNRAAFRDACQRARALAQRHREPLALAILDLDRFKSVNDTHGHAVGDEVLRRVAVVLTQELRVSDMVARWGGEEFVVLLPNTTQKGALLSLERALEALRHERFEGKNGDFFTVTFSAGLVLYPDAATLEEAVNAADRLLYLAKVAGRNRIFAAEADQTPPPRKVLFAGDDPETVALAREQLKRAGLEFVQVPCTAAAVEAALDAATAVVVLDVRIAALHGVELLTALRRHATAPAVPIVVLAASSSEDDIVRSFELGAEDYVVKPFSGAELTARVRRLVKRY
jgi:diguanylate cyclase (GGDEF)-like protein